MKIITLNFTKILAEHSQEFKPKAELGTNISFLNLQKEESPLPDKESEAIRLSFNFTVTFEHGEILLEGFVILLATKDESKQLIESWKDKKLPVSFNVPVFNYILRKCSIKAIQMEEELGLPLHIPLPQLKAQKKDDKEDKKDEKKK